MPLRETNAIEIDGDAILFYSEYDPDFVYAIKEAIPVPDRAWDPQRYCWVVHKDHTTALEELIREYMGISVHIEQGRRTI